MTVKVTDCCTFKLAYVQSQTNMKKMEWSGRQKA